MDDDRQPEPLFCGDVATSARRPGRLERRYKDTLKNSLKLLHINPEAWDDQAQNRPVQRIASAKAESKARKALTAQYQQPVVSNMSPLQTQIPRAIRPRRAPSNAMHLQSGNAEFSSNEHLIYHPYLIIRDDNHPSHRLGDYQLSAIIDLRHHPAFPNLCVDHSDRLRQHHYCRTPPPMRRNSTSHHVLPTPSLLPHPSMRTRSQLVLTAITHSPHTLARTVTCVSIARRLGDQCSERQHTSGAHAATVHITLVHSTTS
ncbi:hypothetical protein SprV_0200641400 [Sparganum proliferum]